MTGTACQLRIGTPRPAGPNYRLARPAGRRYHFRQRGGLA